MDEKKVREAIELIDGIIEAEVILPEGVGDINKALDLAIEALKKTAAEETCGISLRRTRRRALYKIWVRKRMQDTASKK